jgi:hypothetical protein
MKGFEIKMFWDWKLTKTIIDLLLRSRDQFLKLFDLCPKLWFLLMELLVR